MVRAGGYAIALVVGLIGGLVISGWLPDQPTPWSTGERSLPIAGEVLATGRSAGAAPRPALGETRSRGVSPLAVRLLDDGETVLAEIMETPHHHPERLQAMALAALIDPALLTPYRQQIRGDAIASGLLLGLGYALFPSDQFLAEAVVQHAYPPQQAEEMLSMMRSQLPPPGIDPQQALIDALRSGDDRAPYLSELLSRLAATGPEEVLALLEENSASEQRRSLSALVYRQWLRADPERAVQRLREQESPALLRVLLDSIALEWGAQQFEAAERFADTLRGTDRSLYLKSLAGVAARGEGGDLEVLLSRFENMPEHGAMLSSAIRSLSYHDFRRALALANRFPEEVSSEAYPIIASQYLSDAPQEALAWWESLPAHRQELTRLPVARHLAATDIGRALTVAEGAGDAEARAQLLLEVGSNLVRNDWQQALEVADRIDVANAREQLVGSVLRVISDDAEALRVGARYGYADDVVLALRSGG